MFSRMVLPMRRLEIADRELRVDVQTPEVLVPEELLHVPGLGVPAYQRHGNLRPAVHVIAALFRKFRLLLKENLARLSKLADPVLRNHAGRAVGEIRPVL